MKTSPPVQLALLLLTLGLFAPRTATANSVIAQAQGLPIFGGQYHCLSHGPGGGGSTCSDPSQCCPPPGPPKPPGPWGPPGPPFSPKPGSPPPSNFPPGPPWPANQLPVVPGQSAAGVNEFDLAYGNASRTVADLALNAGGGSWPLTFARHHNSRFVAGARPLGQGGHWRHSFQWEPSITGEHGTVTLRDPTGRQLTFEPPEELPPSGPVIYQDNRWGHRLSALGTNYLLTTPAGWTFQFGSETDAEETLQLRFLAFQDSAGAAYPVTTDDQRRVTRVTEPAGRYLQLTYHTNGLLTEVAASDGRSVTYAYDRQTISAEEYYDLLETVTYPGSVAAHYQYYATTPAGPPYLLATMDDPMVPGLASRIRYDYYAPDEGGTAGVIYRERHLSAEVTFATLAGSTVNLTNLWTDFRSVTDAAGHTNSFDLAHGNGYTERLTNALGFVSVAYQDLLWTPQHYFTTRLFNELTGWKYFGHDKLGNLLAVTNADAAENLLSVETWTRDEQSRVLGHTNVLGRVTSYTYATNGSPTRIDHPDTTYETFACNSFGQTTQHRLKSGGTNSYAYSTNGLCTHFTNALGHVTAYTYDAYDRLASQVDARGNTNSYTYDARGYLVKITHPDGSWVGFGHDNYGNKTRQTNELGKVWTWNYNELSQMTNSVDPLGRTTTYEYGMGQGGCCGGGGGLSSVPTKIITPSGRTNVFEYDAAGRKVAEIVAYGTAEAATNRFEYDGVGNLTNRIDALGNAWKTYYNELRQPVAAVDPLGRTNSWTYDALGNKLSETRPDNTTTTFGYDSMNRLIATTNALSQVVRYGYDVLGNLITLVDTKGNTNQWAYSLLGHRLSKTYADSTQDTYAYDAVGNLTNFVNAASESQALTYDSRNRPTLKSWSANGETEGMTYDSAGRLLTLTNSISVLTNAYDDANQLTSEVQALYAQTARTVSYTYNLDGQRKQLTYPAGTVITNDYNARGLLASISASGPPPLAKFFYDARGQRTQREFENGVNTHYTNDAAGQLLALAHVKTNGGSVLVQVNYGYNEVGNRTNRVESFTGFSSAADVYGYDATYQLTNVNYSAGARVVGYNYDPMGNLTNRTDTAASTTTFTANNLNQLSTQNGTNLTYDAKGNLLSRPGWAYTWNAKSQLTIAEQTSPAEGSKKMTFAYDGRNRCAKRRTYTYTSGNWSLTLDTCLYYQGWNLIEERDANGSVIAAFANGPVIDEVLAKFTSTNTFFYHGDSQNSTLALSDANANAIERYRYDAFGLPSIFDSTFSPLSSSLYGVRHLFQGREWIAEVKLSDHRFRYYLAEFHRWLSRDPLGEAGGYNIYQFVLNNPLLGVDPFGLQSMFPPDPNCLAKCGKQNLIQLALCSGLTAGMGLFCFLNGPACLAIIDKLALAATACFYAAEAQYALCVASCVVFKACPYPIGPYPGGPFSFP